VKREEAGRGEHEETKKDKSLEGSLEEEKC
jgi:hypothetical protein